MKNQPKACRKSKKIKLKRQWRGVTEVFQVIIIPHADGRTKISQYSYPMTRNLQTKKSDL